jgi:hypothetical protein
MVWPAAVKIEVPTRQAKLPRECITQGCGLLLEYLAPDQVVERQEDPRTLTHVFGRSESLLVIECGETSKSADGLWPLLGQW